MPCSVSEKGLATNCPAAAICFIDGSKAVATKWNEFCDAIPRTEARIKALRDVILAISVLKQRPSWKHLAKYGVGFATPQFERLASGFFTEAIFDSRRATTPSPKTIAMAFETADHFEQANFITGRDLMRKHGERRAAQYICTLDKLPWSIGVELPEMAHKALALNTAMLWLPPGPEREQAENMWSAGYSYEHRPQSFDAALALRDWAKKHYSNVAQNYLRNRSLPSM